MTRLRQILNNTSDEVLADIFSNPVCRIAVVNQKLSYCGDANCKQCDSWEHCDVKDTYEKYFMEEVDGDKHEEN